MCGICGVYDLTGAPPDREGLRRMRSALVHRGPDDEGEHVEGGLGLGFRRLSILDLAGGRQPMTSADGRFTIVYNGEIYNHPALRRELQARGVAFRTRSDTETLLELYAREGAAAFARLSGMFAAALWDRDKREVVLVRDPLGIKPLYYSFDGRRLAFASELRAMLAGGALARLDPAGVADYLLYGKVHSPLSLIEGVRKLPPGRLVRISGRGLAMERFWRPSVNEEAVSPGDCLLRLEELLVAAAKSHTLADVPVGVFLSGGVDSSLIAALLARHGGMGRLKTFSVGFKGAARGVDESAYAREVARHIGSEHHEVALPADVLGRIEELVDLFDEPVADSAILPTYLLARFARDHVKVALTGEGADELFAGYGRHKAAWLNEGIAAMPRWARGAAASAARRAGKGEAFRRLPFGGARDWAQATAHADIGAVAPLLEPEFLRSIRLAQPWEWIEDAVRDSDGSPSPAEAKPRAKGGRFGLNSALAFDLRSELADGLLMKVDKTTMRASLEARVPFLDKAVVEYALRIPARLKVRLFKGKHLLRLLAGKYLPRRVAWRRKHGFIVPWENWVRSGDNPSVKGLLADPGLESWGLFDRRALGRLHSDLMEGRPGADAGLFFRIALLGLWLNSLRGGRSARA